jgi:hypothetical protein
MLYHLSCGVPEPYTTAKTDSQGHYAIGDLSNEKYLILPQDFGYTYSFSHSEWVMIPQDPIKPYNFTATAD